MDINQFDEVFKLLKTLNLSHYEEKFREYNIDARTLYQQLRAQKSLLNVFMSEQDVIKLKSILNDTSDVVESTTMKKLAQTFNKMKKPGRAITYHDNLADNPLFREMLNRQLNLVAIGKTGEGKSSTLNSILKWAKEGCQQFIEGSGMKSVTEKIEERLIQIDDKNIRLVDTVGLFDSEKPEKVVLCELGKCIAMCSEGIHAFLMVVNGGHRFTDECRRAIEIVQKHFGSHFWEYAIVIITGSDLMNEKDRETASGFLQELKIMPANTAQKRHVFFDNKSRPVTQVEELLTTIVHNVSRQNGPYTNYAFKEAQANMEAELRQAIQEVELKRDKAIKEEREKIEEEHRIKIDKINKEMMELKEKDRQKESEFEEVKQKLIMQAEREKKEEIERMRKEINAKSVDEMQEKSRGIETSWWGSIFEFFESVISGIKSLFE